MFELHDFYQELMIKYNLTYDQVERIARSEFRFLMNNIQSGEFKNLKLIGIGKFLPNKKNKLYIRRVNENNVKCSDGHTDQGEGQVEEQNSVNSEDVRDTLYNARTTIEQEGQSNDKILSDKE